MTQPIYLGPAQHSRYLRRPLGGRLRTYRPRQFGQTHLETIRKALVRGELTLNGLNRWRLLQTNTPVIGWTFTEAGLTAQTAESEIQIVRREAGQLRIILADETTAEEMVTYIESAYERPDLLIARRDWVERPAPCPPFRRMLEAARNRGLTVHLIAALCAASSAEDDLHRVARQRWQFYHDPLFRPLPRRSKIERRFGETLTAAGLDPIPQHPVSHYFLDFAVIGNASGLPVRLDVEVDGRHWHEELPNRRRPEDERRDRVLKRLGWRPIRLWTDEIERDEMECIKHIAEEAASAVPLAGRDRTTEENA